MKTLVIGLGKSGESAYDFLKREGERVVGVDDNRAVIEKLLAQGKEVGSDARVEDFDRVVVSPGIPPSNRFYAEAQRLGKEIIGEAELAFRQVRQPCIGITGTNGKTTVTLLTEHVLQSSGMKARALGNVGTPLTSYVGADADEIFVVELSSFQLETMKTPVFDTGVVLNVTPDHLDRYDSMEAYAMAKLRLQQLIKPSGSFWVHADIVKEFSGLLVSNYQTYGSTPDCTLWTDKTALMCGEKIETILPIRYKSWGDFESQNVLAVWMICKKLGVGPAAFLKALETFKKPPHRVEFVASLKGVDYFNDSKGTNIDATIKAVESMVGKVVLIVGGVDKGSSYTPWKKPFANKVRHVIALGQAAPKIAETLKPEWKVEIVATLKDAVDMAAKEAQPGDSVLLSPGCSSYDMFESYVDRGVKFIKFVYERS